MPMGRFVYGRRLLVAVAEQAQQEQEQVDEVEVERQRAHDRLARQALAARAVAARRADYDLTRADDAERLFAEARPELVFHLAAEVGGIGANRANPGRYWYANIVMGANVLEQARVHGVEKLVIAGTVCSYPKHTPVPFREDSLWDGYPEETNAPYGIAKKAVLAGAQAYREQYGLRTAYLLPANLYGPGDHFHPTNAHVIPDLIRKMVEGTDEIVLWGDGSPTREFLYVDDAVEGLVLAGEYTEDSSINGSMLSGEKAARAVIA